MGSVYHAVSTLEKHTVPPRPLVFVVESQPIHCNRISPDPHNAPAFAQRAHSFFFNRDPFSNSA